MTGISTPANPDDTAPDVGQRIRLLRVQRGLSLRALAQRCGLSINAINRIERGENSPTVASLHLLATALNVPITEFFHTTADRVTVLVKRDSRLRSQRGGMNIESLGIGLHNQQLEPFLVTLQPGVGIDSEPITHNGQEFVYCVEGQVEYQISADLYTLEAGDSLLFEASQPHVFRNPSQHPALILMVFHAQEGNHAASQRHLNT
jgi:transcriptional regulator with XRE-family HTH domain